MPNALSRAIVRTLRASATTTTSSNSGNLKDTANDIAVSDSCSFILNVTNLGGTPSAANLDVWIDESFDGGTTWCIAYKFGRVTTSTSTMRIDTRTTGLGYGEAGVQTGVLTTSTVTINQNTVLAEDTRIRWEIGGASSAGTATFGVYQVAMPPGSFGR